jgi:hypothetical protein
MIILSILIALAALFNALMDTLETEISFNASKFAKLDKGFWCKPVSAHAMGFLPGTRYRADAWHICKSMSLSMLIMGIALAPSQLHGITGNTLLDAGIILITLSILWVVMFNFFYKIFKI